MRHIGRTMLATALIPGCALALTGCGSKASPASTASTGSTAAVTTAASSASDNAGLSQSQLLSRLGTALASVTAMHMKGTMSSGGDSVSMDMQLNQDGTAQGTISVSGMTLPMIVVGSASYIQITPSYESTIKASVASSGDSQEAGFVSALLVGKWVKLSGSDSLSQGMGGLTSFSQMKQQLESNDDSDTYTYEGKSTIDGQAVAQYKDYDKTSGTATMSVPLTGSVLPVQLNAGSQGTMMTFTWNEPTKVTAPAADDVIVEPSGS